MDRMSRQRSSRETAGLESTIGQMGLTDIHRIVYPRTAAYIFFSSAHKICSKIDHMLGHKTSLSKFKKTEITPCIFSDYNSIKLELITRGKLEKSQTHGR